MVLRYTFQILVRYFHNNPERLSNLEYVRHATPLTPWWGRFFETYLVSLLTVWAVNEGGVVVLDRRSRR